MLKYDYFSVISTLTDKSSEAVSCACAMRAQAQARIRQIRAECYKTLCELEGALLAEFLPPLERASIAAYSHSLCVITDASLIYATLSPMQRHATSPGGFDAACLGLCELLSEGSKMLDGIKKSADAPKLLEFREKKSAAMESLCESSAAIQGPRSPQIFSARRELITAISDAFDALVELILKNI